MRVLVVSATFPKPEDPLSGGFIHRQVAELIRAGVQVDVLVPIPRRLGFHSADEHYPNGLRRPETLVMGEVNATYVPYAHLPHRLAAGTEVRSLRRALLQYIRKEWPGRRFDLVHGQRLFPDGLVGRHLADALRVPAIASARGSDVHTHPRRSAAVARQTRQTIEHCDQLTSVSHALAADVHKLGTPPLPIEVIYNGVDLSAFRPLGNVVRMRERLELPLAGTGIGAVCRLAEPKGVMELLVAFERIYLSRPDVWLTIVGDGPLREALRLEATRRGIADRLHLPGSVAHRSVPEWLNALDVFVLPSHNEGLPNVVLEAMACGKPIVATTVGGIPEAALDGVAGLLVPPRDIGRLAAALEELLSAPELRARLGAAGRRRVEECFTWSANTRRLFDLYERVTEGAAHRAVTASVSH